MRNVFLELRSGVLKYEFKETDELSSKPPRPRVSLFTGSRLFTHFHCAHLSSGD